MSYSIAHTIPEEDHENYITEEEAIDMIRGFNFHLKNLSIQVDELGKSNNNLVQKVEKEKLRNESLRLSILQNKAQLESLEIEREGKSQHLAQLEMKIHSEAFRVMPGNFTEVENHEKVLESGDQLNEMIGYLGQLESYSIILKTQQRLLEKKLSDKNHQINTEIKCVNCRERYVPVKNHNRACAYHSGKLRYFSCRGCGGDPYYDCCLKCKSCSKGCKISHHTS